MIEPNELRIGNFLYDGDEVVKIAGFMPEKVKESDDDKVLIWTLYKDDPYYNDCYPEHLNPIPVTEEWLLRFGFEQLNIATALTDEFEKDSIILAMPTNEGAGFQVCIEKKYINLNIVWVHQLQNLYFALTGEELTIE